MQHWDITVMLALMFTVFVIPYEVTMDAVQGTDWLFWVNQVTGLDFVIDMGIQFVLPVILPTGIWVKDHRHSPSDTYERGLCSILYLCCLRMLSLPPAFLMSTQGTASWCE
mmetsp:Transcript_68147/g.152122  ORF Transcript_68147/g.152122 Transcript_68147/m.152122 type:complete len:111 (-) Transcript_68147:77-409(-)